MLNNLLRFGVPRDSTKYNVGRSGLPAGWTNLSKLLAGMKRTLFSEQNTVRIMKIGGQARKISWSRILAPLSKGGRRKRRCHPQKYKKFKTVNSL
jgi:hypothetical protein